MAPKKTKKKVPLTKQELERLKKIDTMWMIPDAKCWIEMITNDELGKIKETEEEQDVFAIGQIVSLDKSTNKVTIAYDKDQQKGETEKYISQVFEYDTNRKIHKDMCEMEVLNEGELAENLKNRFLIDDFYTYIGPTLIAINPFKFYERINNDEIFQDLQVQAYKEDFKLEHRDPHAWAIAAMTFKDLFETEQKQAICISGESGAGKTEATKICMQFLTQLGNVRKIDGKFKYQGDLRFEGGRPVQIKNMGEKSIEDKIMACNPILEAYGNAKTSRNDNSSRFGKYVTLIINQTSRNIVGATIENYLLEKSRIVMAPVQERNYHIFYGMCTGMSPEMLKRYHLQSDVTKYNYLKKTGVFTVQTQKEKDSEVWFDEVLSSFHGMNFKEEEIDGIWKCTAAALILGQLKYNDSNFDENIQEPGQEVKITTKNVLKDLADLIGSSANDIEHAIVTKTTNFKGQIYTKNRGLLQCQETADTLAKAIYNNCFDWLVKRMNFTTEPSPETLKQLQNNRLEIGLLDIFGFECMKFNSIEQFCINFTNEKLQKIYLNFVFDLEEQIFKEEGLGEIKLDHVDNQEIIDLMQGKKRPKLLGIFQLVNSVRPDKDGNTKKDDAALFESIKKVHKNNQKCIIARISQTVFTVLHTAMKVDYDVTGFVEKNRDEVRDELKNLCTEQEDFEKYKMVKMIFKGDTGRKVSKDANPAKKPSPKEKYLGYKFQKQMNKLMIELQSCMPHFIRCIKPNSRKDKNTRKRFFGPVKSLLQIRYMGVLDTIKVRQESFPQRKTYIKFYERYQELNTRGSKTFFDDHVKQGSDFLQLSKECVTESWPEKSDKELLWGKTKVFMTLEGQYKLEAIRTEKMQRKIAVCLKIQNCWRIHKNAQACEAALKKLKRHYNTFTKLQNLWGVRADFQNFNSMKVFAKQGQSWFRRQIRKREFQLQFEASIKIQAFIRGFIQRQRFKRIQVAKLKIALSMRKYLDELKEIRRRRCLILSQECFDLAWQVIEGEEKTKCAILFQRHCRGQKARRVNAEIIRKAHIAKLLFIQSRATIIIQKYARGFIQRRDYLILRSAAIKIQSYFKTKWLRQLFLHLQKTTQIIQRNVRFWLTRKHIRDLRLKEFQATDCVQYEQQNLQNNAFNMNTSDDEDGIQGFQDMIQTIHTSPSHQQKFISPKKSQRNFHQTQKQSTATLPFMLGTYVTPDKSETHKGFGVKSKIWINKETSSAKKQYYQELGIQKKKLEQQHDYLKVTGYEQKKIYIRSINVDLDVMTDITEIYEENWLDEFARLQKFCLGQQFSLSRVQVGDCHTLAQSIKSKCYSWGLNDYAQVGRPRPDKIITDYNPPDYVYNRKKVMIVKKIASGADHGLLINAHNHVYAWGRNDKGQLGQSHLKRVNKPVRIPLQKNLIPTSISAKGNQNIIITNKGSTFYWPYTDDQGIIHPQPIEIPLPYKMKIKEVAMGYNFVILLSKGGLILSFGKDNNCGQLGQGDLKPREVPTLVKALKFQGERINVISCGFKHVICKSNRGKIYTWGSGSKGQLGHGSHKKLCKVPKNIHIKNISGMPVKILSIGAGFMSSYVITDEFKFLWCGSNGQINMRTDVKGKEGRRFSFSKCRWYKAVTDIKNKEQLYPIKIDCSWSKTLSFVRLEYADANPIKLSKSLLHNALKLMISKWEQTDITTCNSITLSILLINISKSTIYSVNIEIFQCPDNECNISIPLTEEDTSEVRAVRDKATRIGCQENSKGKKGKEEARLREDQRLYYLESKDVSPLSSKLEHIKERLKIIMNKHQDDWTQKDIQFMKLASNPKMIKLLKTQKAQ